jgi:hypothetical protein
MSINNCPQMWISQFHNFDERWIEKMHAELKNCRTIQTGDLVLEEELDLSLNMFCIEIRLIVFSTR